MKPAKNDFHIDFPLSLQDKFAPCRGSSTVVVARALCRVHRDIEGLPVPLVPTTFGGAFFAGRGRMGEAERQVEGLFESLLSEAFDG